MTKILSIDQSITSTGYAIIEGEKLITSGTLQPKHLKTTVEKIIYITNHLESLVNNDSISYIAREGFSFGSKNRAFVLGGLGYAIDCLFHKEYKNRYYIIPPSIVKKFITGSGNAKKDQMMLQTYKKYQMEFKNNDECDAFSIGMFLHNFLIWNKRKQETLHLKYEVECFKAFEKIVEK